MDDLYAKFLPQFTALARDRMQRAYEAAERPEGAALTAVMRDLHGIAGEAGLLGLAQIVPVARAAEDHAKRLRDGHSGADAFLTALNELGSALEAIAPPAKPKD
jgi:HPt (histidine-containing phosphotransfer) domain-containing protein